MPDDELNFKKRSQYGNDVRKRNSSELNAQTRSATNQLECYYAVYVPADWQYQ